MKSILSTNPTFTPGVANTGTLNFSAVNGFNIAGLLAVLNQTRGVLLYATGEANTGYFSWNSGTKLLTLKVDTSTHSSGDQLQVIYDGPSSSDPSQTAYVTGSVTNQVITIQPAIMTGMVFNIPMGSIGYSMSASIRSGTQVVFADTMIYGTQSMTAFRGDLPDGGIDCPNGISLTTVAGITTPGVIIYYILK